MLRLTGGVCAVNAPSLIAGGAAIGAVTADRLAAAWGQLEKLVTNAMKPGPATEAIQYALYAERAGLFPTVRGELVYLNRGEVWKYGMAINESGRYPPGALEILGLRLEEQARGTVPQMYVAEKVQIINYVVSQGSLPPGNKIFK